MSKGTLSIFIIDLDEDRTFYEKSIEIVSHEIKRKIVSEAKNDRIRARHVRKNSLTCGSFPFLYGLFSNGIVVKIPMMPLFRLSKIRTLTDFFRCLKMFFRTKWSLSELKNCMGFMVI